MTHDEFYTQKIKPIEDELASLGWAVTISDSLVRFQRDNVLVYFFPENYTNKKFTSRVYPVGVEYRDLSYSLKHEFLSSLKSRNVTEKTKPSKIIDHLQSLYDECSQVFTDELEWQNKIKAAEKEHAENLERVRTIFNGRIWKDSIEFAHKGSSYGNSASAKTNGYDLQLNSLSLDQLLQIKNILEV